MRCLKVVWLSVVCLLGVYQGVQADHIQRIGLIREASVVLRDGNEFGKIYDFVLTDGGCIDYVVVAHQEVYYVVPWSVVRVNFSDRVVRLNVNQSRLDRLSFRGDNWPNLRGSAFAAKLRAVYGVSNGRAKVRFTPDRPERVKPGDGQPKKEERQPKEDKDPKARDGAKKPEQEKDPAAKKESPKEKEPTPKKEVPKDPSPKKETPKEKPRNAAPPPKDPRPPRK